MRTPTGSYAVPAEGASMAGLCQHQCNAIARNLNTRPGKRLGFRTTLDCFNES